MAATFSKATRRITISRGARVNDRFSLALWCPPSARPGETIEGVVDVTGTREVRGLRIEFVAVEHVLVGLGRREARPLGVVSVAGPGTLTQGRYPWRLTVPLSAIPAYRTLNTAVAWAFRAVADVPGADVSHASAISIAADPSGLLPPNLPPGKGHTGRKVDRGSNVAISIGMTAVFVFLSLFALVTGLSRGQVGGVIFGLGLLPFAGLGGWLVRRDLARARSSIAGVKVTPRASVVRAGEQFVVDHVPGPLSGLEIGLVCEEWFMKQVLVNPALPEEMSGIAGHEVPLHQAWQPLTGPGPFLFGVPPGSLPSYHGDHVTISWEVRVRHVAAPGSSRIGKEASQVHRVAVTVAPGV
jgi:hypothetical protein